MDPLQNPTPEVRFTQQLLIDGTADLKEIYDFSDHHLTLREQDPSLATAQSLWSLVSRSLTLNVISDKTLSNIQALTNVDFSLDNIQRASNAFVDSLMPIHQALSAYLKRSEKQSPLETKDIQESLTEALKEYKRNGLFVIRVSDQLSAIRSKRDIVLNPDVQKCLCVLSEARRSIHRLIEQSIAICEPDYQIGDGIFDTGICLKTLLQNAIQQETTVPIGRTLPFDPHIIDTGAMQDVPLILGDKTRLQTAFCELLRNAAYSTVGCVERGGHRQFYTRENSKVSVCTSEDYAVDGINIEITDTGIGMSSQQIQEAQAYCFSHTTEDNFRLGRMGVGVPLSLQTIRDHGGYTGYESQPGKGTTVKIWLPQQTFLA